MAKKTLYPSGSANDGILFLAEGGREEVNYKKNFCEKYFDKGTWSLDVLNQVDVLLQDRKGRFLLYIESKHVITNEAQRTRAIAQAILTNKKQKAILSCVAIIYLNGLDEDVLELIDCSDDSVMYNNDINWASEKPSNPTKDAVDRINDRVRGKIKRFKNEEIKEFYDNFKKNQETTINITEKNFNVVYNLWKNEVRFKESIDDEQDRINLFLVDLLNGTTYKKSVIKDIYERTLFETVKVGQQEEDTDEPLIREGTNLRNYTMMKPGGVIDGFKYAGTQHSTYYTIANVEEYNFFWNRYKRPPEKHEFLNILERSSKLYSEKYRKDTGGEYTPTCFVELQNKILQEHYNMDEFIVCDPCGGVGNLENQFGKDYKQYCYLSTLEQMDVDICKIKGFENAVQFDYLKDDKQPLWKYKGEYLPIEEIAKREGRKLMIVMNPPYQRKKGFKYDLAIEFFIKVLDLHPDVIVYYCKTEFFLRDTVSVFANSGYKCVSHVFSSAKETFLLSDWSISQVIFDKNNGEEITGKTITAQRYELSKRSGTLEDRGEYIYDNVRPCLIPEIEHEIKQHSQGMFLGQWTNQNYCLVLSNRNTHSQHITTENIGIALMLKGLNFNTHGKYYETSNLTYKGKINDISKELKIDAMVFSLFYKGNNFSNKEGQKNYIMPFTAEELGCAKNDLNVLFPKMGDLFDEPSMLKPFDFREYLHQFEFSEEAKALYQAALEVFRYYHRSNEYENKNYNDSYYDITNAIMGKDVTTYQTMDKADDKRITKVRTTKGTKGFGRNTIAYAVGSKDLPIFYRFFDARDVLARKINKQLVEQNLLLWERENIY